MVNYGLEDFAEDDILCAESKGKMGDSYRYLSDKLSGDDVALEALGFIRKDNDKMVKSIEYLVKSSSTDSLTGLKNRRALNEDFDKYLSLKKRSGTRMDTAVIMLDLDKFKRVNDTYGHIAGDDVLKEVAKRLKDNVRSSDEVYRFGGEEMCIVLYGENSNKNVLKKANDLRKVISGSSIAIHGDRKIDVSGSFGAYIVKDGDSIIDALSCADSALYFSKESGRNQTNLYRHSREVERKAA